MPGKPYVWERRRQDNRCAQCQTKIPKRGPGNKMGRPQEFCEHCAAERIRERGREYRRRRRAEERESESEMAATSEMGSAEFLGHLLGVSPDRLADHVRAEKDREKARTDGPVDRVRTAASAVHKSRRAVDAAMTAWRIEPTPATLDEVMAARRARDAAEELLLDELLNDRELMSSVLRQTRP